MKKESILIIFLLGLNNIHAQIDSSLKIRDFINYEVGDTLLRKEVEFTNFSSPDVRNWSEKNYFLVINKIDTSTKNILIYKTFKKENYIVKVWDTRRNVFSYKEGVNEVELNYWGHDNINSPIYFYSVCKSFSSCFDTMIDIFTDSVIYDSKVKVIFEADKRIRYKKNIGLLYKNESDGSSGPVGTVGKYEELLYYHSIHKGIEYGNRIFLDNLIKQKVTSNICSETENSAFSFQTKIINEFNFSSSIQNFEFSIYNINGMIILNQHFNTSGKHEINCDKIQTGIYIIQFKTMDGKLLHAKILKE